jgi:predicted TIM-barrel fold metal-dependent hydrolase
LRSIGKTGTAMGIRFGACACCDELRAPMSRVSRRRFIAGGLACLGAAAVPIAAPAAGASQRIDVHHHYIPPFHADFIESRRDRGRTPAWSVARSLDDMDQNGIATAVTSLAQPGVWFGDVTEARRLARECNEWGAAMARDHPGRFGLFAAIPLPDTEGSLREIEYALDVLKADGIGLFTSYRDKYPGDPAFAPVFDELNRRKAVVYTHPITPDCCKGLVPGVPASTIEYATDTTRAIASLVFGGTTLRCPDIRFIFSHSGGTVPFLTARFERLDAERKEGRLPNGPTAELQKLYYEVAQGTTAGQLAALTRLASLSHVLFGTDFPFRPGAEAVAGLTAYDFTAADRAAIERGNALALLPRLRA